MPFSGHDHPEGIGAAGLKNDRQVGTGLLILFSNMFEMFSCSKVFDVFLGFSFENTYFLPSSSV